MVASKLCLWKFGDRELPQPTFKQVSNKVKAEATCCNSTMNQKAQKKFFMSSPCILIPILAEPYACTRYSPTTDIASALLATDSTALMVAVHVYEPESVVAVLVSDNVSLALL